MTCSQSERERPDRQGLGRVGEEGKEEPVLDRVWGVGGEGRG